MKILHKLEIWFKIILETSNRFPPLEVIQMRKIRSISKMRQTIKSIKRCYPNRLPHFYKPGVKSKMEIMIKDLKILIFRMQNICRMKMIMNQINLDWIKIISIIRMGLIRRTGVLHPQSIVINRPMKLMKKLKESHLKNRVRIWIWKIFRNNF